MKVTLNWLKQYVDFDWSPEELGERLTMLGIEVEGVQKLGGEFEGVVVAQVITRDKHPNADKLSLCRVNDGQGERQIVCGAQNFQAGDKVPLVLPGASLPAKPGEPPFTIKVGKIRGIESYGMMCSAKELGIAEDAEGLLILSPDAKVGQAFAEYLGRSAGDLVYDLEITPNRPDLNSVIGIAREISALTGNPLKLPQISVQESGAAAAELVRVRIDDAELCPRYTARVVRGVKVGPSPDWLKNTLEKVGIRSISNVVDVTNFVMLEIGQPLHAFDYHLIAKGADGQPAIVIRRAVEGEKFTTLDGQERTLSNQMLLIADESKGIALAGIMGGQNSEINQLTVDVLIESAYFKPQNIRATSKKLELRSESSYRFERGGDVGICDWASQRAAHLMQQTAGGQVAGGVVDVYPQPAPAKRISLRFAQTNNLLGITVSPQQQAHYLHTLGLLPTLPEWCKSGVAGHDPKLEAISPASARDILAGSGIEPAPAVPDSIECVVPSFRVDLKREVDLIEEITRLYGIDKIPSTPPRGAIGAHVYDAMHDSLAEARRILSGLGLNEAQGQTLISDASAKLVTLDLVALQNPLSSDMNVLRPSLLPGLLDALRHNVSHRNSDVALFEVGRVFSQTNGQIREERRIAIALTGQRNATFWSGEERAGRFDVYDLKGLLEEFLEQFGLRGMAYARRPESTTLLLESATIQLGKQPLGEFGQLVPTVARHYDLREAVLLAELNLDLLLARRNTSKSFKALPAFPTIRRDVAMLVPEPTTHEAVLYAVKQAKPQNLEAVELFDVFRGQNVPTGQKSMAYTFTYRNAERTLTDTEVNAAHDQLVAQFKSSLQATIRE